MSDTDSFIHEVSDELRRDQLFGALRKYGWIGGTVLVLIVGGAAGNEYLKAQARAEAQESGGQLYDAAFVEAPADRAAAFAALDGALPQLGQANALVEAGDVSGAAKVLEGVLAAPDSGQIYRDIAALKLAGLEVEGGLTPEIAQDRLALLQPVIARGSGLSLIARELSAGLMAATGDRTGAVSELQSLYQAQEITPEQRDRVRNVLVALGEDLPEIVTFGGIAE